jgi:hypothetical protein
MQETYASQGLSPTFWIVWCVVVVFEIAAMWTVYQKAGRPGWAAIIPIYNLIVMLQVARKPIWWIFLFLIPLVNIIIGILMYAAVAKNFGKGTGFTLGLIFLGFIFFPILAWSDATYQPPPQMA